MSSKPCKFFLQGYCRFGDTCWNQHIQPGQQSQQNQANRFGQTSLFGQNKNDRFHYNANQNMFSALASKPVTAFTPKQNSTNTLGTSVKDDPASVIQLISKEMQAWGPSKMWPLSCFAYAREQPCLSGLTDYSPEELRIEAYKAKENNTLQQYVNGITQLGVLSNQRKNELKSLTQMTLRNEIQKSTQESKFGLQQTQQATSLFGNQSSKNTTSTINPFGKQSQSAASNPFASPSNPGSFANNSTSSNLFKPSALAQNTSSGFGSVFGKPAVQPQAVSPFGAKSTSVFGTKPSQSASVFGTKPALSTPQPAFGAQSSQQPNTFGQSGLFGNTQQSVFGSSSSTSSAHNPFKSAQPGLFGNTQTHSNQQPSEASAQPSVNPFLSASKQNQPQQQSQQLHLGKLVGILSHISFEVTPDDLAAFKATSFTLGSIPERPPPIELC